ncbi:flagellar brake protein [Ferrovum myxofaciens]|uniref:flagellar brake protein n=1 Tax=Ferrovum myxofaciens TaxID=416213 RepID=UPI002356A186|nr:flagellar brake protein [Ferrovum myxofaciens]MBU6995381.1 flagellar brake protein [Ferrovum myxofaciens]
MSSKANISSEKVEPSMVMSSVASLNLQVGELLQAQVWAGQNSQKYSVRLIGYCEKRSVLVTAPEFNGHVILAHEGQNIVMRYFSGKNVDGCQNPRKSGVEFGGIGLWGGRGLLARIEYWSKIG